MERLRLGSGIAISAFALGVLFYAVTLLRGRDYLGCVILVLTGLSLLRAGTELLRPCSDP
jgi:hypothetical protein